MLLSELAAASGTSAASIKYYRREGLLPPGERVTATRQDYGRRHLERLELIAVLREVAEAPIARIRRLTAILDDPRQPLIRALAEAQTLVLGLDEPEPDPAHADPEHPSVAETLAHLGWPDVDSAPRRALDRLLRSLDSWGAPTDPALLRRYAEPMAEIARADVDRLEVLPDGEGAAPVPADVQVMRAVSGAIAYDRLVRLLRALGHASYSVLRADPLAGRGGPRDGPPRE